MEVLGIQVFRFWGLDHLEGVRWCLKFNLDQNSFFLLLLSLLCLPPDTDGLTRGHFLGSPSLSTQKVKTVPPSMGVLTMSLLLKCLQGFYSGILLALGSRAARVSSTGPSRAAW